MFAAIFCFFGKILKWTFLTILILICGQLVHWRDQTVSDHIKTAIHRVEYWSRPARQFAEGATERAQALSQNIKADLSDSGAEKFSSEERARLRKVFHN
ncbi:MAG: hypothetical protein RJB38_2180 [Pseudomonadota bacterium]|jgi:hypothetical protein